MIPEKVTAIGIVMAIVAGAFFTCAATSSAGAETTERTMWPLGTDILVGGDYLNNFTTKYVQLEPGEIVTVNWKSGSIPTNAYCTVKIYTGVAALNWSSDLTNNVASWAYTDSPAKSVWLRAGGYDVVSVAFGGINGWWTTGNNIVVNITVTQDNYTFAPDTKGLKDKIDALQAKLDAIDISSLQKAISDLQTAQASLTTQINGLRDVIALLQVALNQNGQNDTDSAAALQGQITALSEALTTLENVSAQNSATLTTEITLLTEKVANITSTAANTTTIINNTETIENPYNDTALWDELAKVEATPPIVQYNNTTQVHPATTTYVNKTTTQKAEGDIIPAIVAGVLAGVLTAIVVSVIMYAQVRRRYGGVVKPADSI